METKDLVGKRFDLSELERHFVAQELDAYDRSMENAKARFSAAMAMVRKSVAERVALPDGTPTRFVPQGGIPTAIEVGAASEKPGGTPKEPAKLDGVPDPDPEASVPTPEASGSITQLRPRRTKA